MSSTSIPCFLCYNKFDPIVKEECDENFKDVLQPQLTVIFLLRKILKIPNSISETLLLQRGNPTNWITNCYECKILVEKALQLHQYISNLRKEYELLTEKIVEIVEESKPLDLDKELTSKNEDLSNMENLQDSIDRIRNFIFKDQYYKASKESDEINVKCENDDDSVINDDFDEVWKPQRNNQSNTIKTKACILKKRKLELDSKREYAEDTDWEPVKYKKVLFKKKRYRVLKKACTIKFRKRERDDDPLLNVNSVEEFMHPPDDPQSDTSDKEVKYSETLDHTQAISEHINDNPLIMDNSIDELRQDKSDASDKEVQQSQTLEKEDVDENRGEEGEKLLIPTETRKRQRKILVFASSQSDSGEGSNNEARDSDWEPDKYEDGGIYFKKKRKGDDGSGSEEEFQTLDSIKNELKEDGKKRNKKIATIATAEENRNRQRNFCDICQKQLSDLYCYRSHVSRFHSELKYVCKLCGKGFGEPRCLQDHSVKVHPEKHPESHHTRVCKLCKKSVFRRRYDQHMLLHQKFTCNICGNNTFIRGKKLHLHIKAEHPENFNKRKCPECGIDMHKCSIKAHMIKEHTKEYSIFCPTCNVAFASQNSLKIHLVNVHNQLELKPWECRFCSKRFYTSAPREYHEIQMHTKEFKFICEVCGKGFVDNCSLEKHKVTHGEFKKYSCDFCGQRFRYLNNFKTHQRGRHYKELNLKPFKCETCGKIFADGTGVKVHSKREHEKMFHVCDICGAQFIQMSVLKEHIRITHTGETPFKCKYCPDSFPSLRKWQNHTARHEGRQFKCDKCPSAYFVKRNLQRHRKTSHGDTVIKDIPCFLCYNPCDCTVKEENDDTNSVIIPQLRVIFLLRNILKIPRSYSETLLGRGNPTDWIINCTDCKLLLEKSLNLHRHISMLQNEYKSLENEIIAILNKSKASNEQKRGRGAKIRTSIDLQRTTTEIRNFIFKEMDSVCAKEVNNMTNCKVIDEVEMFEYEDLIPLSPEISNGEDSDLDWEPNDHPKDKQSNENTMIDSVDVSKEALMETQNESIENSGKEANQKKFMCKICQISYGDIRSLSRHKIRSHSVKFEYVCKTCGKGFVKKKHLKEHGEKVHPELFPDSPNTQFCEICKKSVFKRRYDHHMQRHEKYSCKICQNNSFLNSGELQMHTKEDHPSNLDYPICVHCNQKFSKHNLTAHIRKEHAKEFMAFCSTCDVGFQNTKSYKRHMFREHGEMDMKPFLCNYCPERFLNNTDRAVHETRRHTKAFKHICELCGKGFATTFDLNLHIKKHGGSKPFTCDLCGEGFWLLSILNVHQRGRHYLELNLEPYKCFECDKTFKTETLLRIHNRMEHDKNFFECATCGAKFAQKSVLIKHLRNEHLDDSHYKCTYCSQSFTTSAKLRYHIGKHAPVNRPTNSEELNNDPIMYNCDECSKKYLSRDGLRRHKKNHTNA